MQRNFLSLVVLGALSLGALGLAACGGGGSEATDESYAREMCTALSDYQDAFEEALSDIDPEAGEDEMVETLASTFRDLADSMDDVNPPSDLSDVHDEMVSSIESAASALEDGNMDALNEMDTDVDQEIQDRLDAAAADVEECEGVL
ncbi:MAG: hypothetical protein U5Q44_04620 [Dehalococcoidia bacterium]|nr:hypothetical protein [Dehalococcoidia bacterium]